MIENGYLQGPFIHIFTTSKKPKDENRTDEILSKTNGIFETNIFTHLPFKPDQKLYVALKSFQIDNSIINYDSNEDGALYEKNGKIIGKQKVGQYKIDNVETYIEHVFNGAIGEKVKFEKTIGKICINLQQNEELVFSKKTIRVLGLNKESFTGPCYDIMQESPDLFYDYRPLLITSPICSPSFVNQSLINLIAQIDGANLKPWDNHMRALSYEYDNLQWNKLSGPLGEYIKVQILTDELKPVSLLPTTNIHLHLIIRASDYELI